MYVVSAAMVIILASLRLAAAKKSDVITFAVAAVLLLALYLVRLAFEVRASKSYTN